eukprot:1160185-Pelagomonas_calceolata.AAC.16
MESTGSSAERYALHAVDKNACLDRELYQEGSQCSHLEHGFVMKAGYVASCDLQCTKVQEVHIEEM